MILIHSHMYNIKVEGIKKEQNENKKKQKRVTNKNI